MQASRRSAIWRTNLPSGLPTSPSSLRLSAAPVPCNESSRSRAIVATPQSCHRDQRFQGNLFLCRQAQRVQLWATVYIFMQREISRTLSR